MLHRFARHVARLLLAALLAGLLPSAHLLGTLAALAASAADESRPPVPLTVTPVTHPHLPSLTLRLAVEPDVVAVGDTATLTVTVTNQSPYSASDLVVTLPTPSGAIALAGPNTRGPAQGWRWTVGSLDAQGQLTLTGQFQLVSRPAGGALLLQPQATARDLTSPVLAMGGALVVDRTRGAATARFTPGQALRFQSSDGRVEVELPAQAATRPLTLRHSTTPLAKALRPPLAGFKRGFGTFFLDASDDAGSAVHQFRQPLTITLHYTPEQLQVLGLNEATLTLSWFDEAQRAWVALPTQVDVEQRTVRVVVDHFSAYNFSDGSSPSAGFIPSLQGFQTSLFTGAASYRIPIELPAGAGGLKPSLALNYSSAASDSSAGVRTAWQAPWLGKGWSLEGLGFVATNTALGSSDHRWDNFTLVFGGQSFDVVKGELLPGFSDYFDTDLAHWSWHAVDENFARVRVDRDGSGTYQWHAWTKDGTRYDFSRQLWQRQFDSGAAEIYKWLLTQVVDASGNAIRYTYHIDPAVDGGVNLHPTAYLQTIEWGYDGATPGTGTPRYRVLFTARPRSDNTVNPTAGVDTAWEYPGYPTPNARWQAITPHETYRLDAIAVQSQPPGASSYQLVQQYNLRYADAAGSVQTDVSGGQKVLTLLGVQRVGRDGTSALPETSFSYGMTQGNTLTPTPGWNRLLTIDNGQGGRLSFTYEHTWLPAQIPSGDSYTGYYQNYYRVIQALAQDTSGQSYSRSTLTTYSYTAPALNDQAHAATVLYARYPTSGNGDSRFALTEAEKREFRGHASVVQRTYDGATTSAALLQETQHWFYQGDAGCTPALITLTNGTQGVDESNSCYQSMVQRESWKGREYQADVRVPGSAAGANPLQRTQHSFGRFELPFFGSDAAVANASNNYRRAGLWRAFIFESQTSVKTYDPTNAGAAPALQTTTYTYDVTENTNSNSDIYGNLSREELYDGDGTRQRITKHFYAIHDTASVPATGSPYIVDHPWADYTWDGSFQTLAYTAYFYDNGSTQASIAARGLLTRQSAFYDLPSATNPSGVVHSRDMTFSYDAYGNRLTETSYAQAGTAQLTSSWGFSPPGSSSTMRTTSTTYDSVFHAFPIQVTNALNQSERADYDERMGTLIRVTGPNTTTTPTDCSVASYLIPASEESTCAQYDVFGRMVKLVKPGDSSSFPTLQASYFDSEQPSRYRIDRRETVGTANARSEQQFYDGLGRKIQVKAESINGTQNIVADTRYDALSRAKATSQARYVSETATSFVQYTNPGTGVLYRETTTSYDGLGRVLDVLPDPALPPTRTRYSLGSLGVIAATTDSNSHKVERETDEFGRLRQVREYNGTSSYMLYATTSYTYDALDQLTRVTDAGSPAGNVTAISYDSLGRKKQMDDSDMGVWNYSYDANGNLLTQTDAKGQVLWFGYDALDRLTQKRQSNSGGTVLAQYSYDAGTNGKGHRTGMSAVSGASSSWAYDARGRKTQATHTVAGLSGTRVFGWAYDSGDRLSSITYPIVGTSTETVTYSYDAAWRPTSACSNLGGCYVQSALYTALSQPDRWALGNNLIQKWSYSSPLQRLSQLQVGVTIPPPSGPASVFDRSYSYDNVGNVDTIADNRGAQTQNFDYDHLDRLTHGWTTGSATAAYDETYSYNTIGNLTNKDGVAYTYPASGATSVRPHTPTSVGGTSYVYDADGNLTSGAGRTYTWTLDNLPASVSQTSGSESYSYDGDGERVKVVRGSTTTVYLEGLWEEVAGGAAKASYTFSGQVVAVRDRSTNIVTYLHGDHLGSVSVATTSSGAIASQQEYTPFGSHRGSGDVTQTSLDYTGQRLDGTGLLYYHARMYDPALGRFVSPDSIVPGAASGTGGGAATLGVDGSSQLKALTVDFHEPGFVATLNDENQQRFWFQMSDEDKRKAKSPWGPANPQALNRYSYVLNNPIRYVDPSGHTWYLNHEDASNLAIGLRELANMFTIPGLITTVAGAIQAVASVLAAHYISTSVAAALSGEIGALVGLSLSLGGLCANFVGTELGKWAELIDKANTGLQGVALKYNDGALFALNRQTGDLFVYSSWYFYLVDWSIPDSMRPGIVYISKDGISAGNYYFASDEAEVAKQRAKERSHH